MGSEDDPTKIEQRGGVVPPADLVEGEQLFWKMADVKGFFTRRVVTGYLITNYRCFVWDAEENVVRANVPVSRCEAVVSFMHRGVRSTRGGRFLQPPPMGEREVDDQDRLTTIGDVSFRVGDKTVMIFREVTDPEGVKRLVDSLRLRGDKPADERIDAVVIARSR